MTIEDIALSIEAGDLEDMDAHDYISAHEEDEIRESALLFNDLYSTHEISEETYQKLLDFVG